jgi:hypothetical protein
MNRLTIDGGSHPDFNHLKTGKIVWFSNGLKKMASKLVPTIRKLDNLFGLQMAKPFKIRKLKSSVLECNQ